MAQNYILNAHSHLNITENGEILEIWQIITNLPLKIKWFTLGGSRTQVAEENPPRVVRRQAEMRRHGLKVQIRLVNS